MRNIWIGFGIVFGLGQPALAEDAVADWRAQKCGTYAAAWQQALDFFGSDEVTFAFMVGNENFIASGCTEAADICPRSDQELEIANALTLAMMNAGSASTFLPFRCPLPQSAPDGWTGPGL